MNNSNLRELRQDFNAPARDSREYSAAFALAGVISGKVLNAESFIRHDRLYK